jgi:ELWxxDGT repeat protein
MVGALLLLTLALIALGGSHFTASAAGTHSASTPPMKLSQSGLAEVTKDYNEGDYPAMYAAAASDLVAHYPNATGADADVISWLKTAQQVNSGAKEFHAIAIRAVNAVGVQYEQGESIGLYGPEEQRASNTIAKGFFAGIKPDGTIQTFDQIINNDAGNGLNSLGLSRAAWAGALPHLATKIFTDFTTDNYFYTLSPGEQQEACFLHVIATVITFDYILGEGLGLSEATLDNITETDIRIALELDKPVQVEAALLCNTGTVINATNIALQKLATSIHSSSLLNNAETAVENMFGTDQGVDVSKDFFQVGGDINLDLSNSAAPRFSLYLSSNNGDLTLQDASTEQDVTFLDASGVLQLKDPQKYTGFFSNFSVGDTIDLAQIGATSATLGANNVLEVNESDGSIFHLNFDPKQDLTGKNFVVSPDDNGGTDITLTYTTPGKIVFNGYDAQGTQGLWVTDGTATGTIELEQGLNPTDITTFGNRALFSGYDAQGNNELWITDGTSTGTIELSHVTNNTGGLAPYQIAAFGKKSVFNGTDTNGKHELWVTDGKSVQELNNIPGEGSDGLNPADLTALGSMVLFDGYDSTQNYELWITDGTVAGTRELTHITSNINGLGPDNITVFGKRALFAGWDSNGNDKLWVTDGNTVTELPAFGPDEITVIGNRAVFRVGGSLGGLWVTDGIPAGTMQLLNIPNAADAGLSPGDLTAWGNQVLFSGLDNNDHDELWVTDGTVAGTREETNIASSSSVQSLFPAGITAFGKQALFYGIDPNGNEEIWAFNGGTTIELTTPPSTAGPYLNNHFPDITVIGNKALFNAQGADRIYNLCVTDGTPGGTTELTNIANAGSSGLSPSDMMLL